MTATVLKDAYVAIDGVEISGFVTSVTLNNMKEVLECTVMGDDGKRRISGLYDASAELELNQEATESVGSPATTLEGFLFDRLGDQVTVAIRRENAAISTTNPEFQFNAIFGQVPLVGGAVGEVHKTSITLENADGAAMVRDTVA